MHSVFDPCVSLSQKLLSKGIPQQMYTTVGNRIQDNLAGRHLDSVSGKDMDENLRQVK